MRKKVLLLIFREKGVREGPSWAPVARGTWEGWGDWRWHQVPGPSLHCGLILFPWGGAGRKKEDGGWGCSEQAPRMMVRMTKESRGVEDAPGRQGRMME